MILVKKIFDENKFNFCSIVVFFHRFQNLAVYVLEMGKIKKINLK